MLSGNLTESKNGDELPPAKMDAGAPPLRGDESPGSAKASVTRSPMQEGIFFLHHFVPHV
jgi:hypothetical protein